jgi:hypothetical protein
MTVFNEIDGKSVSHMAETNHTDTSDDEFAGHEFLARRKAALLGGPSSARTIQMIQCAPLLEADIGFFSVRIWIPAFTEWCEDRWCRGAHRDCFAALAMTP